MLWVSIIIKLIPKVDIVFACGNPLWGSPVLSFITVDDDLGYVL
jgi:hypothetical protein